MAQKGWHKESARHSLAARGCRTAPRKSEIGYRSVLSKGKIKESSVEWTGPETGSHLSISSKMTKSGVHFPFDPEDKLLHNEFTITVKNRDNGVKKSFKWYDSAVNYQRGITKMDTFNLINAVGQWFRDAWNIEEYSLEGWAEEMGYDEDSRQAERMYKGGEREAKKIGELFGTGRASDTGKAEHYDWLVVGDEMLESIGEM